jgi:hypothetical protein
MYGIITPGAEPTENETMKSRWHRLLAALGIGLGIEVLEVIFVVSFLPSRWADSVGDLPLQPASYLVTVLEKRAHPGFEEQVGYLLFVVLLQWLIYSGVVYLLLAIPAKKNWVPRD